MLFGIVVCCILIVVFILFGYINDWLMTKFGVSSEEKQKIADAMDEFLGLK